MKFTSALLTFSLLSAQVFASEIHPFIRGFGPVGTTVEKEVSGASSQIRYDMGITYNVGAEFLMGTDFSPFYFGGGVGVLSAQKSVQANSQKGENFEIVPWTIPAWASVSWRASNSYENFVPYATLRGGWAMPLSIKSAWWNSPANFVFDAALGAIHQTGIGFEISYTYTSLKKSYEKSDVSYRVNSGRFGLAVLMNFELTHTQEYVPNEEVVPEAEETEEHVVNTPVIKEISSEPEAAPAANETTTEQPEANETAEQPEATK